MSAAGIPLCDTWEERPWLRGHPGSWDTGLASSVGGVAGLDGGGVVSPRGVDSLAGAWDAGVAAEAAVRCTRWAATPGRVGWARDTAGYVFSKALADVMPHLGVHELFGVHMGRYLEAVGHVVRVYRNDDVTRVGAGVLLLMQLLRSVGCTVVCIAVEVSG